MTDSTFTTVLAQCMPEYRVVENIGSGNFGSVYKCERDGVYYAIKIISVPGTEAEMRQLLARSANEEDVTEYLSDKVEAYRREIMLMAELKGNRSIVNIEDYKVWRAESGIWYIVIRMELLTSLPLYAKSHPLDEAEVIRLGIDICDALEICEKHGIIHRDVKPENIMHHSEGAYKLGDFGVAKQLSRTTTGTIAGTEGFIAPEIYKGQLYNQAADVYSLGIVLYYYLNNRKMPYVEPDNSSLIAEQNAIDRRMTDTNPLPPPQGVNPDLGQILVKACMYNKKYRYQSAAEMRADLVRVQNGQPVEIVLCPEIDGGTIVQANPNTVRGTMVKTPFEGDIVDRTGEERQKSRSTGTPIGQTAQFETDVRKKKSKKKGVVFAATFLSVALVGTAAFFVYKTFFAPPAPGTYVDENGETYVVLSREEMEEAYNKGMQYAEAGNYADAIAELGKVSTYSKKYEEAQAALLQAQTDYRASLIEQANTASENRDYDRAFSLIDTGIAALGDGEAFRTAKDAVLAALKADYVTQTTEYEKNEAYDKALECVTLALTYLPDDYELKGIQSRVNAASVAQKAIARAADYANRQEYAKLFSSLDKAIDDVADSTTATASLKLTYDNYMKEYMELIETQTTGLSTTEEYETAVKLLTSAVEIFPNDYDLKSQLTNAEEMTVATRAITEAAGCAGRSEYATLFPLLSDAMEELPAGSDAYQKVQATYDKYKKSYTDALNRTIGKPKSVTDYDNAIAALETATAIFPNDTSLQNKLEKYRADKPVALFSLDWIEAKGCRCNWDWKESELDNRMGHDFQVTSASDVYGNKFENTAVLYTSNNAGESSGRLMFFTYDVEDYKLFTGGSALWDKAKSFSGYPALKFFGCRSDGVWEEIYNRGLKTISKPSTFSLDITKYQLLQVRYGTYENSNYDSLAWNRGYSGITGVILYDCTLSK